MSYRSDGSLLRFPLCLYLFAQNVEVLREICIVLDGYAWIRFYGSSSGSTRLCALLPSHTVWQKLDEKDLKHRNIFSCVRNYYLTCSYDPPAKKLKRNVDNQTGENWSSLFLVLRWVVYDTCFIPVNVISLSDSTKLTFMCTHDYFTFL